MELIIKSCDFTLFEGKKVLITGGTGMVGSYLAEAIIRGSLSQGVSLSEIKITGKTLAPELIDRFSSHRNVKISTDLLNDLSRTGLYQVIFHLASPASPTQYSDLETLLHINSKCLANVVNETTERFIFVSTGEVYGNKRGILSEEDHGIFGSESPRDWYPYAKLKGEEVSKGLCTEYKSNLNIVRLFHTFGPGVRRNDGRSFADFLYSAAAGDFPKLYSDGSSLRTFLFSADAIVAILTILTKGENMKTYNVGSDSPISILDFAKKVSEIAGLGGKIVFDTNISNGFFQSPNQALVPNLTRVSQLGWKNTTTLEESIENTLHHIKLVI